MTGKGASKWGELGALETAAIVDRIPELTLRTPDRLAGLAPFKCFCLFAMEESAALVKWRRAALEHLL